MLDQQRLNTIKQAHHFNGLQQNRHRVNLAFLYAVIWLSISAFLLNQYLPIAGTIDLTLIQPWMSAQGEFPLKQNWFLATLSHHYVKNVLIIIYVYWAVRWLQGFKNKPMPQLSWRYGYAFSMVIVSSSMIGLIKSQSDHACPWDMVQPMGKILSWNFHLSQGHCFPGGHASAGFSLLVGYFIFKDHQKNRAYFYLLSSLILGFAMGWAQMMRGAHFLSHNLWTLWIIWLLNILAYFLIYLPHFKSCQFKTINLESSI